MSPMSEKLRFIMAIDPARAQIDFDGVDDDWGQIAATVTGIEAALAAMNLPAGNLKTHMCDD
jgi:long-chain acyl-CoA synthetase